MLQQILGVHPGVFVGMTLLLMGLAAFLTGQAIAATWRPVRQVFFYAVLLGIGSRFLSLSLFYGDPFFMPGRWLYGAAVDAVVLAAYALFAYRLTKVAQMVKQYPWVYERSGLLSYRSKA